MAEWALFYLLQSDLTDGDPAVLWSRYVQLTQIEAVFRWLKSELADPCTGLDASGGTGEIRVRSDDRCSSADCGWPLLDFASIHATRAGSKDAA